MTDRPGWVRAWEHDESDLRWSRECRPVCPSCGTTHNKAAGKCPARTAARQTGKEDWAWWKSHPDVTERVRPLTVEEQLCGFIYWGALHERVLLVRGDWFRSGGGQSCSMDLYYPA